MNELVLDSEILYRRVVYGSSYEYTENGEPVVTQTAFSDPKKQPSVDRALLCNHDPSRTQGKDLRNGVVSLITAEVRAIGDISTNSAPLVKHTIDVIYVPILDENLAHAEIRAAPEIASDKVFRRLRVALAILAQKRKWEIYPSDYRDSI